jgi:hypothetical protein
MPSKFVSVTEHLLCIQEIFTQSLWVFLLSEACLELIVAKICLACHQSVFLAMCLYTYKKMRTAEWVFITFVITFQFWLKLERNNVDFT